MGGKKKLWGVKPFHKKRKICGFFSLERGGPFLCGRIGYLRAQISPKKFKTAGGGKLGVLCFFQKGLNPIWLTPRFRERGVFNTIFPWGKKGAGWVSQFLKKRGGRFGYAPNLEKRRGGGVQNLHLGGEGL